MPTPSTRLILHGKVASRDDVRAAVYAVRDEGHEIEVCVTWEGGDAARFARQAAQSGIEMIIAGGGDGTINQVVSGLLGSDGSSNQQHSAPMLGVLPLGTANDLARSCGIPLDPLAALRLAVTAPTKKVDVGQVNGRSFINVATGGFGTQVTVATPNDLKKLLGGAAYFLTGVTHFSSIRPAHCRLAGPDLLWEGELLVLGVGNGRQAGGGHQLCPDAIINDGLLEVCVLPRLPPDELARCPASFVARRPHRHPTHRRQRSAFRGLKSLPPSPCKSTSMVNRITDTHFRFEIFPQRLADEPAAGLPAVGVTTLRYVIPNSCFVVPIVSSWFSIAATSK